MEKTLLFNRSAFEKQLNMGDYIQAVSKAHQLYAQGNIIETNLIHANAPNGEYHIKSGGLLGEKSYYGIKANGGFFSNGKRYGLPNILGIIYLSDATNGFPLAIFESSVISKMRTGAATAVAAKYLKPMAPVELGIIGYGNQAEAQIEALLCVCDVKSIKISGRNQQKLIEFTKKIKQKLTIPVNSDNIENTCKNSNIIITCTPSTEPLVSHDWIQPGTFIGAIGADSPGKNELDPKIIQTSKVVCDLRNQTIKVGESQHAIKNEWITPKDIYAELGDLIIGKTKGRSNEKETFVYDSTGTAIQDIACAAFIYEKLKDDPTIAKIDLFG